ncbi:hypothetical protein LCGC14_0986780 [marine sediment metagenome]|uniref:Uncharacterized protein n=1 Tax=marine sediment metagenome TaxID=412755 RepID=A0A0F9N716_9ZZZZ
MLPIETESTNLMLLPPHGQEDRVFTLPCTKISAGDGGILDFTYAVESCWQMTWRERFKVLWTVKFGFTFGVRRTHRSNLMFAIARDVSIYRLPVQKPG